MIFFLCLATFFSSSLLLNIKICLNRKKTHTYIFCQKQNFIELILFLCAFLLNFLSLITACIMNSHVPHIQRNLAACKHIVYNWPAASAE